jgi:signal transduction histidine kinase
MYQTRLFGRTIAARFFAVIALSLLIAGFSLYSLLSVVGTKDRVISDDAYALIEARTLENASEHQVSSNRAYLLTGDPHFLEKEKQAAQRYRDTLARLRAADPDDTVRFDQVDKAVVAHQSAVAEAMLIARGSEDPRKVAEIFEAAVIPKREALRAAFADLIRTKEQKLAKGVEDSDRKARRATLLVGVLGAGAVVIAIVLFFLNARSLVRLGRVEAELRNLNESLERRVLERTRQLRQAVTELEGFAYTIAHDLRAPLRAMAGLGQLVAAEWGPRLDQDGRNDLARIVEAARRMDDQIQGLLQLIHLSSVSFPLEVLDVQEIVRQVVANRRRSILAAEATVEVDGALPAVRGNAGLLRLALEQLTANALEFARPGVPPRVRIHAESMEGKVRLFVEDNGIGIAREYHDLIFGVFHRLNRMEDHPGVGVGLALVRKAVERMGGLVGVDSEPGAGSSFWIELESAAHSFTEGSVNSGPRASGTGDGGDSFVGGADIARWS